MNGLLKLFAFACCVITAAAVCTSSKYKQGPKDWLQCSESSIAEVKSKLQVNLIKIWVSQSNITEIPDSAFTPNGTGVEILNLHSCGISRIGNDAFNGLYALLELSLSHNNITTLIVSWFDRLPLLKRLDLSFNKISNLDSFMYIKLSNVQRFDINDNLLNCLPTKDLQNMRQLNDIRIQENPLTHICRAELTLWLHDHKVSYALKEDNFMWLDSLIWECYWDLTNKDSANSESNLKMNTCVYTNMFDQLTTVLGASRSIESSTIECSEERTALANCLWEQGATTNGQTIMNLLALAGKEMKNGQA